MAYRVDLTDRAERDLGDMYVRIEAAYSEPARAWFNRLEGAIMSLQNHPSRGVAVPEDLTLRQLLHGRRPHVYRIIYTIDEPGLTVVVLHVRHGARDAFGE